MKTKEQVLIRACQWYAKTATMDPNPFNRVFLEGQVHRKSIREVVGLHVFSNEDHRTAATELAEALLELEEEGRRWVVDRLQAALDRAGGLSPAEVAQAEGVLRSWADPDADPVGDFDRAMDQEDRPGVPFRAKEVVACVPLLCPYCGELGFHSVMEFAGHLGDHVADLRVKLEDRILALEHQKKITGYLAVWVVELDQEGWTEHATKDDREPFTVEQVLQEAEESIP